MLYYQTHVFHVPAVLRTGRDNINTSGIDAGMSQYISKFGYILFQAVKYAGKKAAQIMREDLCRIYVGLSANAFHLPPDIGAAYRSAGAGNKYRSRFNALFRGIAQQFFPQCAYNENRPGFSFKRN